MSRRRETAKAPPTPRACERPEQSGGPGRRENLERSVREEARLGAGEILPTDRLAAAPAGSSALRDMQGWTAKLRLKETIGASPEGFSSSVSVTRVASLSARDKGSFGRRKVLPQGRGTRRQEGARSAWTERASRSDQASRSAAVCPAAVTKR